MTALDIRAWVEQRFGGAEATLIIEAGAHRGEDTAWLAQIPGATVHSLEPDPRNELPQLSNVTLHRKAVAAHDGTCQFILSTRHRNPFFRTAFSSIRKPKTFQRYPYVAFGEWIEVQCTTLDTLIAEQGIDAVDLIWADVQGAEGDLIQGGRRRALACTRYLYTEYCPDGHEWYEGQVSYSGLLEMLPAWRVLERWHNDVLLENTTLP